MARPLLTVGHSTRSLEGFLSLLRAHGVERIADVRRFPGSRRSPHFGLEALRDALRAAGLEYAWFPQLGGRRARPKNAEPTGWRVPAFGAYADHMRGPEFRVAVARLLEEASESTTAILCAEAFPYQCHRRLIADWAALHEVPVEHILGPEARAAHRVTPFARLHRDTIVYDPDPAAAETEAEPAEPTEPAEPPP